jgi:hypothetical protein
MIPYPEEKTSRIDSFEREVGFGEPVGLSAEDAELAKLGYKQEFDREFSWLSTFSFAFSISGLLATVIRNLYIAKIRSYQLGAFLLRREVRPPPFGAGFLLDLYM